VLDLIDFLFAGKVIASPGDEGLEFWGVTNSMKWVAATRDYRVAWIPVVEFVWRMIGLCRIRPIGDRLIVYYRYHDSLAAPLPKHGLACSNPTFSTQVLTNCKEELLRCSSKCSTPV
jgi:hypothetical protein